MTSSRMSRCRMPIVVDGVLYGAGAGKVIALDAATGAEKWVYAPTLPQKSRVGFSPAAKAGGATARPAGC